MHRSFLIIESLSFFERCTNNASPITQLQFFPFTFLTRGDWYFCIRVWSSNSHAISFFFYLGHFTGTFDTWNADFTLIGESIRPLASPYPSSKIVHADTAKRETAAAVTSRRWNYFLHTALSTSRFWSNRKSLIET